MVALDIWRNAGQHFVHDDPEAVDIGAEIDFFAENLFRRHVFRRTDDIAGLGQGGIAGAGSRGNAKIHDFQQTVIIDQEIGRLQVTVNDAIPVRD